MKFLKAILVTLAVSGCAHLDNGKHAKAMEYNQTIGDNLVAHKYGNIYFSGQPSTQDIAKLKKQGFVHIINMRKSVEENYKESEESQNVKKVDINYSHAPIDLNQPLTDQYIEKVVAEIMTHRKEGKTLVHCSSGQRVALWTGAHFYKDHGYSKTRVEDLTEKMGLEKQLLKEKLKEYTSK